MTTLAQLRTQVRERADQELGTGQDPTTHFITDTELTTRINKSAKALYDLLIQATDQNYYLTSNTPTVTAGTNTLSLPTDFYKLKTVEKYESPKWRVLRKTNFNDRNKGGLRYTVRGSTVELTQDLSAGDIYKFWYSPKMTEMSSDSDSFDGINGWEEYIVLDVAIYCKNKEESDPSALMAEKQEIVTRIEALAADRDVGESEAITDRRSDSTGHWFDENGWEYFD